MYCSICGVWSIVVRMHMFCALKLCTGEHKAYYCVMIACCAERQNALSAASSDLFSKRLFRSRMFASGCSMGLLICFRNDYFAAGVLSKYISSCRTCVVSCEFVRLPQHATSEERYQMTTTAKTFISTAVCRRAFYLCSSTPARPSAVKWYIQPHQIQRTHAA